MSSKFRTSRSVRVAAAGGVLGVAAAVAGLGATGAAQADTTQTAVEGSAPHTLVITLDDGLAQSLRAAILEALAAAQQRSDDARAQGMKGGSPTGLAHSQRWHAAAAHAAHPPAFAGTDGSDAPAVDDTGDDPETDGTGDESDGSDDTSDGDHSEDWGDNSDGDGDHYGDRDGGDDHGDWGDHSDGDGGDQDGGHDDGGWGDGGHDD